MNLSVFDFQSQAVRTQEHEGNAMFANVDVCRVLELNNPRDAISDLDPDEKITVANSDGNPRAGIPHQMVWLTESGLYALIFKSRKPQAKAFRKWVTSVVLPQIRKTGAYAVRPPVIESEDDEVRLIALAALRGLRDGSMSSSKANAMFAGLKAYQAMRALCQRVPGLDDESGPDPISTRAYPGETIDFGRLVEYMRTAPDAFWTPDQLREAAVRRGLFSGWLSEASVDLPATRSKFGKLCCTMHGQIFGGWMFLVAGYKRDRRFSLRAIQQPLAGADQ